MGFELAFYTTDHRLIAAILLVIMDINRPQRGGYTPGVDTLDRARDIVSGSVTP